jgi:hypothetical protein
MLPLCPSKVTYLRVYKFQVLISKRKSIVLNNIGFFEKQKWPPRGIWAPLLLKNYSKYRKYKIFKHIYWLEEKKERFWK